MDFVASVRPSVSTRTGTIIALLHFDGGNLFWYGCKVYHFRASIDFKSLTEVEM